MRNRDSVHRNSAHRNQGFTVVECLIAGVILAMFAAALAGTTAQSTRAATRAQDHRQAAEWLDTILTRIDMIGPSRLSLEGPVQGSLDDRFSWSVAIDNDATYPDLYLISAVVSYTGTDGRPARVVGHTQLHDPVGRRSMAANWEDL